MGQKYMDNEELYNVWIKRADLHYKSGKALAILNDSDIYLDAGTLLQQAAECYLKALLIYHGSTEDELKKYGHRFFSMIEDIRKYDENISELSDNLIDMQYYAVTARYPDNGIVAEVEEVEIKKCLTTVENVKDFSENHVKMRKVKNH